MFYILIVKKIGQKAELSAKIQAVIVALHKGYSMQKIASKTNVSQSAVMGAIQRKVKSGSNKNCHHSGRPKATSKQEDKFICVQSKKNITFTTPKVLQENTSICFNILRCLHNCCLKGCVAPKKHYYTSKTKLKD